MTPPVLCPKCENVMALPSIDRISRRDSLLRTCLTGDCQFRGLIFRVPALEVDIELTTDEAL